MDRVGMGWNASWQDAWERQALLDVEPARVVRVDRRSVQVWTADGERTAHLPGRVRHAADRPAVGDWCAVEALPGAPMVIVRSLLPRRTAFHRKTAGTASAAQVVAANVDVLWLVCGLDRDFNLRRLERYVALAWSSGATPVVVLNKADLCDDVERCVAQTELVAPGVAVYPIAASDGTGCDALLSSCPAGHTAALLGSSGVGKSTLVNQLAGEVRMRTQAARGHDQRGRHTTTHRELQVLPSGALLIDTPGMRELALWGDVDDLDAGFPDVQAAAVGCRFRDCGHAQEPGCAVWDAIAAGTLDADRLEAYQKLQRELAHLQGQVSERERRAAARKQGAYYRKVQRDKRRLRGD